MTRAGIVTELGQWVRANGRLYGALFLLYTVLAIGLTYPAAKGVFLEHTVPGYGDVVFFQYAYWWLKHALFDLGTNPQNATLIYHPVGGLWIFGTLFNEIVGAFLQFVLSVSQTYTLLWLFTFPATALTTFALAKYVTGSRSAAFLAGTIFAFSTYRYAHGLGHAGLFTTQWLPLYAYVLLRSRDRPSFRNGLFLVVGVLLAGLSEFPYYLVNFIGLFLICLLVYGIWTRDPRVRNPRFLGSVAVAFSVLGLVLAAAYSNILFAANAEYLRRPGTFWLSADVLGFLLPSRFHPLWGDLYSELRAFIGRYRLDLVEHSHYIGYASLGLLALGLRRSACRDKNLWRFVVVIAFILALGPALKIGGQIVLDAPTEGQTSLIPLPYWAIMNLPLINTLRAPSRHVVLMQLGVAVMAAAGWALLEERLRRLRPARICILGVLSAMVVFESLFKFPYPITRIPVSDVYLQLAQENQGGGILELPMALTREAPEGQWYLNVFLRMYEATIHRHPIVGGVANRPDPQVIIFNETTPYIRELLGADRLLHPSVEDPFSQDWSVLERVGPSILQSYNIDYVILHRDTLFDQEFQFLNRTLSQGLGDAFFDDGTVTAYRVIGDGSLEWPRTEHLAIVAGKGWYLPLWNGVRTVRRMAGSGQIVILSPRPRVVRLQLELKSRPQAETLIRVSANDHPLEIIFVPAEELTLFTRAFQLEEGYNVITLDRVGDFQYVGGVADMMQFDIEVARLGVVSAGPVHLVSESLTGQFGSDLQLTGVEGEVGHRDTTQEVDVTLLWKADAPVEESYKVFVHLLDDAGNLIGQHDSIPVNWRLPTDAWEPGTVIADRHKVAVLPDHNTDEIREIAIGVYHPDTLQRLTAVVLDGDVRCEDDSIRLSWSVR